MSLAQWAELFPNTCLNFPVLRPGCYAAMRTLRQAQENHACMYQGSMGPQVSTYTGEIMFTPNHTWPTKHHLPTFTTVTHFMQCLSYSSFANFSKKDATSLLMYCNYVSPGKTWLSWTLTWTMYAIFSDSLTDSLSFHHLPPSSLHPCKHAITEPELAQCCQHHSDCGPVLSYVPRALPCSGPSCAPDGVAGSGWSPWMGQRPWQRGPHTNNGDHITKVPAQSIHHPTGPQPHTHHTGHHWILTQPKESLLLPASGAGMGVHPQSWQHWEAALSATPICPVHNKAPAPSHSLGPVHTISHKTTFLTNTSGMNVKILLTYFLVDRHCSFVWYWSSKFLMYAGHPAVHWDHLSARSWWWPSERERWLAWPPLITGLRQTRDKQESWENSACCAGHTSADNCT